MTLARLARIARQRWRSLVRPREADTALDEEFTFHLEQLIAEKVAEGHAPDDARRAALREFGNVTALAETSRDARGWTWAHDISADVRYGLRGLRRSPLFSLVAITSLGLGIGGAATIAAASRTVLWSPLPFQEADRLVVIRTIGPDAPDRRQGVTWSELGAWRTRSRLLEDVAASLSSPRDVGRESGGLYADRLPSQAVTPNLLRMLGARPLVGRLFDDAATPYSAAAKTIILSHRLWQTRYGGSADILGRVIPTDGGTRTVIGVMPPDFRHDEGVSFWIPLIPDPATVRQPEFGRPMVGRARLKHGVTPAQAEQEFTAILSDLDARLPERFRGRRAVVIPLHETLYGWTRPLFSTLFAAAILLLAIACANVTGLLLARATTRQREVWMRLSLGASQGRVIRQLLTECGLLAAGGGTLGLLVAAIGLRVLVASLGPPPGAPWIPNTPYDVIVVGCVVACSVVAWMVCGVPAALAAVRHGQRSAVADRQFSHGRASRTRNVLVATEVAMALVLLVGAGLLGTSLATIAGRPLNFDPDGLGSFQFVVAPSDYSRRVGFDGVLPVFDLRPVPADAIARVHNRLRSVPGIESIGGMTYQPVNSLITPRLPVRRASTEPADSRRTIAAFMVTPDFFATMRTPVIRGREARDGDDARSAPVAIINETAARLFFKDGDALGRRLIVEFTPDAPAREVIGVVADVPIIRRVLEPEPIVYVPSKQMPTAFRGGGSNVFGQMTFVYRFSGDEAGVLAAARQAVADVDPLRPIVDAGVVRRALDARVPELTRYVTALAGTGVIAALLAVMGVYGVTAFAVATRIREIAIRRALGADTAAVLAVVGRRSLLVVGAGLVVGVVVSLLAAPSIGSQLTGVAPSDPFTITMAVLSLGAVATAASMWPARRAVAIAPATVLKTE